MRILSVPSEILCAVLTRWERCYPWRSWGKHGTQETDLYSVP